MNFLRTTVTLLIELAKHSSQLVQLFLSIAVVMAFGIIFWML